MPSDSISSHEAVLFFRGTTVERELLYSEFEALLDGYIPLKDYSDTHVQAVYLTLSPSLMVTGAVFFIVRFEADGMVEARWSVPLRQLLDLAGYGPDLGGGPIRLACYSQCPIAWQQKNLWDPDMTPAHQTFGAIKKALKANRLGLVAVQPASASLSAVDTNNQPTQSLESAVALEQQIRQQYTQELRNRMALLIKDQRLRVSTLLHHHQEDVDALKRAHQERLLHVQAQLDEAQHQVDTLTQQAKRFEGLLKQQADKIAGMREYFTHKLERVERVELSESQQHQLLRDNIALEIETRVKAATRDLEDVLMRRESELGHQQRQGDALRAEIAKLKQERQLLLKSGADHLLGRLSQAGVHFVAVMPGLGEMAIPYEDTGIFLSDPQAYAAKQMEIHQGIYLSWLEHRDHPHCRAINDNGDTCNQPVSIVESPYEFILGESDRCSAHQ